MLGLGATRRSLTSANWDSRKMVLVTRIERATY